MKNLFIIPGYTDTASDPQYKEIIKIAKSKGYVIHKVPIQWKYRTVSDYIGQFKEFYSKHKSNNDYFFGFSYGAVVAFSTAEELKPKKIFLCSLSNDFKEDLKGIENRARKFLGKKRFEDTKARSAVQIAKKLAIPTIVLYGEKEHDRLKKRCEETVKLAKHAKLVVVKNADHEIGHLEYIKAIKAVL